MITLSSNTQFFKDMTDESRTVNVNGNVVPLGYWNLILSIRDCEAYTIGMKTHASWKITNVKKYFGLKGNASELVRQLKEIRTALTNS